VFSHLLVKGLTQEHAPFELRIAPEAGRRRLSATASNAGDLLRALGILDAIQGGTMAIRGSYDDNNPDHTLSGDAKLENFRVVGAVGLGKVLQAMTLYGMVDVLRGPGLGFTTLVAPFRLNDKALELTEARAFSPSLGLTAKGQIDMIDDNIDMEGTIVPAYFFNSLLGNVPLIGRLFSPEQGGGVFAASYSMHGKLSDPKVTVNPLAALTPGFLRGLFGIF
jgi:AsmA-like C-terminal region